MKNLYDSIKKIITNKNVIAVLMAFISYFVICLVGSLRAYDVTSWFILFILIIVFLKTDIFNKFMKKETIILSILFSFLIVYGDKLYWMKEDATKGIFNVFFRWGTLLRLVGFFNIIYIILKNVFLKFQNINIFSNNDKKRKPIIIFIGSFIFIFLLWIPYFITFYPGIMTPDSIVELDIVTSKFTSVSDHHPVLHILFIAMPYYIGSNIFNSAAIGVACVSLTQMLVMSIIFASLITFLYNRKVNGYILMGILLFYAIVPMHGYYSVTMWKDVIFSGTVLLVVMQLIKIIEKEKQGKLKFVSVIPFILISLLCVFFRNNAIYMYMFLALATFIILKKYWKIFIPAFLIIFSVYYIVKGPVFKALNVAKSGSAEYIGMPLQQIGRMVYKDVELTDEEKELIDKLIPLDKIKEDYNPIVSDGIKFSENYHADVFDKNKVEYFKLWLKLVIKHPKTAIEAYSISTLGYWYPGVEYWATAYEIDENKYGLEINSKSPYVVDRFINKVDERNVPIVTIEWSIGLCFWVILICCVLSVKNNKLYGIYPYIPIIGIWITMMIASPVFGEFRYVYGAYTTLPLFLLCPYLKLGKNEKVVEKKKK